MRDILPFVMAGDPTLESLPRWCSEFVELGVSTLEVGVPHSDPVADGPVLQAAAERAIAGGTTLTRLLSVLRDVRRSPDIVLFTYVNPILALGADTFLDALAGTPVRSVLVVDLPVGEAPDLEVLFRRAGYSLVPVIAPTTSLARARWIDEQRPDPGAAHGFAQRFAYVVARLGVTGDTTHDLQPVIERVGALRRVMQRPLAVGFGLTSAPQLAAIRGLGATPVIGSALVSALAAGASVHDAMLDLDAVPDPVQSFPDA